MKLTLLLVTATSVVGQFSSIRPRTAGGIEVIANTSHGYYSGRYDRFTDVSRFMGVRYGEHARWTKPMPIAPWADFKPAIESIQCLQYDASGQVPPAKSNAYNNIKGVEDCLTVDIITPAAGSPGVPLVPAAGTYPVQFWVHGGGLVSESFGYFTYKDNLYANAMIPYLPGYGKIVTVYVHYRVGALGFLVSPTVAAADGSYGNYGLFDIIAAARYTQAEIGNFGGDPTKITINGESGGATLVGIITSSPMAQGIFQAAVMQSTWNINSGALFSKPIRSALNDAFVKATGCSANYNSEALTGADAEAVGTCLKNLPGPYVLGGMQAQGDAAWADAHGFSFMNETAKPYMYYALSVWGAAWFPIIDGVSLVEAPMDAFANGACADCTMVIGENADEEGLYLQSKPESDAPELSGFFAMAALGIDADPVSYVLTAFPAPTQNAQAYFAAIGNDLGFVATYTAAYISWNTHDLVTAWTMQSGRTKGVYRYVFAEPGAANAAGGSPHTADLNYMWGYYLIETGDGGKRNWMTDQVPQLYGYSGYVAYRANQLAMGDTWNKYWSAIFSTGDPNVEGSMLPAWTSSTTGAIHVMLFKSEIPGGAALDPCAMLQGCLAEPLFNYRSTFGSIFTSGATVTSPTCDNPVVGPSRGPGVFTCPTPMRIGGINGALPCCEYAAASTRKLLFGGKSAEPTCRACY